MGTLMVIPPHRPIERRKISTEPSLDDLQEIVGGYIEMIRRGTTPLGEPVQFYVNEEGKVRGMVPNPQANVAFIALFGEQFPEILVGTAVAVIGKDVQCT